MEPLGATLNVVSTIELISKCICSLIEYYTDVMKADADLWQFKAYLDEERETLQSLQGLCKRLEDDSTLNYLRPLAIGLRQGSLARSPKSFYTELEILVQWLEKQGKKNQHLKRLAVSRRKTTNFATKDGCGERLIATGMRLSRRLQWPIRGKKKVERFMPKLARHRDHLTFILQVIQSHVELDLLERIGRLGMDPDSHPCHSPPPSFVSIHDTQDIGDVKMIGQ